MQYSNIRSLLTVISTLALIFVTTIGSISEAGKTSNYVERDGKYLAESYGGETKMALLNDGLASLQMRVDMIRRATKSIELEYFIFDPDMSSKVLFDEIIKRSVKLKKMGKELKTRILIDKGIFNANFNPYYVKALREITSNKGINIEVKYYNPRFLTSFVEAQYRNHRKFFIVDGREFITGGRNIGTNYFDGEAEYNFWDRDIFVTGPFAINAEETFNDFWNSELSVSPMQPQRKEGGLSEGFTERSVHDPIAKSQDLHDEALDIAREYFKPTPLMRAAVKQMEKVTRPVIHSNPIYSCPKATFVSDKPNIDKSARLGDNFHAIYKLTRNVLGEVLANVEDRVIFSSPYFIQFKEYNATLDSLLDRNIDITIYTNSLAATDHFTVSYQFYSRVNEWIDRGVTAYVHSGTWAKSDGEEIAEFVKQSTWGTHSKSHVYDDDGIMVGTYNLDNRSNELNVEDFIICQGNKDLAAALEASIMGRAKEGLQIIDRNHAIDKNGRRYKKHGEPVSTLKYIQFYSLGLLSRIPFIKHLL